MGTSRYYRSTTCMVSKAPRTSVLQSKVVTSRKSKRRGSNTCAQLSPLDSIRNMGATKSKFPSAHTHTLYGSGVLQGTTLHPTKVSGKGGNIHLVLKTVHLKKKKTA